MSTYLLVGYFLGFGCINLIVILIFKYLWKTGSFTRRAFINLSIFMFATLWAFLILEGLLHFAFVHSEQFGFTLATERWLNKYWKPVNSSDYRDFEYQESDLSGKRVGIVTGDSFAAGFGIVNHKDRFSNILQEHLGEEWLILNAAKMGWDTLDEYKAVKTYPAHPEIIILSYYINDCLGTASRNGISQGWPSFYPSVLPIIKYSYLMNSVYWWIFRYKFAEQVSQDYWEHLSLCYSEGVLWREHKEELINLIEYVEKQNSELVVVVFPELTDIEHSNPFTSRVVELFKDYGIVVIDLTNELAGWDRKQLVVSALDSHPSITVHRVVADLLYNEIRELDTR